jgi:hypothetical protein
LVVLFVPFGSSSRVPLNSFQGLYHNLLQVYPPFRRHFTALKNSSLQISSCFLHCFVPHLHTFTSCVRQGYYIHNTASFRFTPQAPFRCIPALLCTSPFIFSAVALSHSHRGWLRSLSLRLTILSHKFITHNSQFIINSVAFPYIKVRLRLSYIFSPPFHALTPSFCVSFLASCNARLQAAVRLPQPRHCAPRLVRKSRDCDAWGCLIAVFITTFPARPQQDDNAIS